MNFLFRRVIPMRHATARAFIAGALILLARASATPLAAQATLEGSKWRIDQEGVDTQVVWWLGSEGRVRTGDLGLILPAYKWRQHGDSFYVSIGDTIHYAAMLMSNRLVGGIRSGRNHQEGWWSGTRADAPTQVAAAAPTNAPATPSAAPATPAGTQPMSRPADSATTPGSTGAAPGTEGRHQLRQIIRGDAPPTATTAAPAGEGRQIRRIERAGEAGRSAPATIAPAGSSADASMVGSWSRADSVGMFDGFDLTADGKAMLHIRGGREATGTWSSDSMESRILFTGPEGGEVRFVIWTGGPGLRGAVVTAAGPRRTLAFRRADGPVRQPAVRQP